MAVPSEVKALVEKFQANSAVYQDKNYNETQVRVEFINPLFRALGWDVTNSAQVIHEARVMVQEDDRLKPKHPDYGFMTGNQLRFYLEAKAPHVNIKQNNAPAFQIRRYGWSAGLPASVLTDFEELVIYDCRVRPDINDKPTSKRLRYYTYTDYLEKWDEIADLLSYEAVRQNKLDDFVRGKKARGAESVDTAFLNEMEKWRVQLAKNIALHNKGLTRRQLNMAVQATIDRIVFLRICEDREIEAYGRLRDLGKAKDIYGQLTQVFKQADAKYNSGLFHFDKSEKGRGGEADEITLNLHIDDDPLRPILNSLYYPKSPYEFSVLPADILGQVYERFLGKVIELSDTGKAEVVEKPEVRKAGGVYYTPTYIVDYIVQNTVGKLVEGKKPDEVAKLRILDPACGSGSFLIGAYQFLLDWHLDWYVAHNPKKYVKDGILRAHTSPNLDIASEASESGASTYALTTKIKKQILLNNIYGVDLDQQAVEVSKLSLLLKMLEGETATTAQPELLVTERVLPDLSDNIKWGNSLIGSDFYAGKQLGLFGDEELYKVKVFDWDSRTRGFGHIMESGGFDAVIGNPPYVRQEILGAEFKSYAKKHYETYAGTADLYAYFIEKGVNLLNNNGLFGIIVANKWMRANYGKALRKWLQNQQIVEVIDFGDLPVFADAIAYPCILIIGSDVTTPIFDSVSVKNLDFGDLSHYVQSEQYQVDRKLLNSTGWSLVPRELQSVLNKISTNGVPLKDVVKRVYYGIKTGLNKAFVIDNTTHDYLISTHPKSKSLLKSFFAGRDVKRYISPDSGRYIILIPRGWTRETSGYIDEKQAWIWLQQEYPAIAKHLSQFEDKARARYDQGDFWWELRACDYYDEFEKEKIVVPAIIRSASYSFDNEKYYSNDKTSIISASDPIYLLGLLNSKTLDLIMHNIASTKQGGYYEYKPMYLDQLPIRTIDFDNPDDVAKHDRMVSLVETMLDLHKQVGSVEGEAKRIIDAQIEDTDKAIDALVYDLYGLTEDEIKIVEGG